MNDENVHPLGDATNFVHEERIHVTTSGTSRSDDLNTINNVPQIRRPAAGAIGSQGRGRAHTLPHDYWIQSNSSPGCERRRRRQRLAHQHAHAAAAAERLAAVTRISACQDIVNPDSGLVASETFPPSPCRPSLHANTRRRLQSLDGGLATAGEDADLICSVPPSASVINGGHADPSHAEADPHQTTDGGGISRNKRWRNISPPLQKLAFITAAVVMACLVVSTVLTTDSHNRNQRSYHRKAAVTSSRLASKERHPMISGRFDPEVRFLPGMRMEIVSEANEDALKDNGEDRDPTLASPSDERGERPDPPPRAIQGTGNGRKKRRPRLAHARASFDLITPSQDADNGGGSGLRGEDKIQKKKTPRRKLPTFVLPPEETEDSARDSMRSIKSLERAHDMSWSKVFVLVAMAVLCIQLLASLRRA